MAILYSVGRIGFMSEFTKFPNTFVSDQFVPYIKEKEIQTIVKSLAHTIDQKYKGEELILVSVLKGSNVFLSDLVKNIRNVKIYIDFVSLSAVGRSKENNGSINIKKDIQTNVLDKNVLIVEEIIDTGRALHFLKNRLIQSSPRNIEIITLFDKPYKRAVPIKADYIGKQIEDQFIVGYGLDLDEFGRNFSDIYYLKYPN
jgi:hypoxanthine phosphoribosyltransferase